MLVVRFYSVAVSLVHFLWTFSMGGLKYLTRSAFFVVLEVSPSAVPSQDGMIGSELYLVDFLLCFSEPRLVIILNLGQYLILCLFDVNFFLQAILLLLQCFNLLIVSFNYHIFTVDFFQFFYFTLHDTSFPLNFFL